MASALLLRGCSATATRLIGTSLARPMCYRVSALATRPNPALRALSSAAQGEGAQKPKNQFNTRHVIAGALAGALCAGATAYGLHLYDKKKVAGEQAQAQKKADDARIGGYLKLIKDFPALLGPAGKAEKGEIELVLEPEEIRKVEKETGQKVGVLAETKWQIWICDAVKFANGKVGIYTRLLWKQSFKGAPGAAVLAQLPSGNYLLNLTFRHPLRKWTLEIPRGNGEGNEAIKAIAERELREETGAVVGEPELIGRVNADSGITTGGISVFRATITGFKKPKLDDAESGNTLHEFTPQQLEEAVLKGYADVQVGGKTERVELADGFTFVALYLNYVNKKKA